MPKGPAEISYKEKSNIIEINTGKLVAFLYTNNKDIEKEVSEIIPFTKIISSNLRSRKLDQ